MGQPDNRFLTLLRSSRSRPLVIAHRGDSFFAPENTREAARRAFEAGADAWEFDVQLSRDGVPIVFHDEWLCRTTDVAERFKGDARATSGFRVSDFDFDELRTLDAGSWFIKTDGRPRAADWFGTRDRIDPRRRTLPDRPGCGPDPDRGTRAARRSSTGWRTSRSSHFRKTRWAWSTESSNRFWKCACVTMS